MTGQSQGCVSSHIALHLKPPLPWQFESSVQSNCALHDVPSAPAPISRQASNSVDWSTSKCAPEHVAPGHSELNGVHVFQHTP